MEGLPRRLQDETARPTRVVLPARLIIRESTSGGNKTLWMMVAAACAPATPAPTLAPAATVDPAACHLTPPDAPVTIHVLGWSFDIMDFYADEFKKCGEFENIDVDVKLMDNTGVYEAVRLSLSCGGKSPYDIVHGSNTP